MIWVIAVYVIFPFSGNTCICIPPYQYYTCFVSMPPDWLVPSIKHTSIKTQFFIFIRDYSYQPQVHAPNICICNTSDHEIYTRIYKQKNNRSDVGFKRRPSIAKYRPLSNLSESYVTALDIYGSLWSCCKFCGLQFRKYCMIEECYSKLLWTTAISTTTWWKADATANTQCIYNIYIYALQVTRMYIDRLSSII